MRNVDPKPEDVEAVVLDEALAVLRSSTEQEVGRALRALRVHVPLAMPGREICRNCGWPMPCATRRLAERVLRAADLDFLIPGPDEDRAENG